MYYIYRHIFPNGKSYIGITKTSVKTRWRNGKGYETQPKMWNAITKYGWENIEHQILEEVDTEEEACELEQEYIIEYDAIENGYNTAIGGKAYIKDNYYSEHFQAMQRGIKIFCGKADWYKPMHDFFEDGKTDKSFCEAFNLVDEKITKEIKYLSNTDEVKVGCYAIKLLLECYIYWKINEYLGKGLQQEEINALISWIRETKTKDYGEHIVSVIFG